MGKGGEPSKVNNNLPIIAGKPTRKLGIAAGEYSDARYQLRVTEHKNSPPKYRLPGSGGFRTSFAPNEIDETSVDTVQIFCGDAANSVVDADKN